MSFFETLVSQFRSLSDFTPKRRVFCIGVLSVAMGCASSQTATTLPRVAQQSLVPSKTEFLLAYDNAASDVEEWTVTDDGGGRPSVIAAPNFTSGVAALAGGGSFGSGEDIVLAGSSPASQTSLYDLSTGTLVVYTPEMPIGPPIDTTSIIGFASSTLYADGSYETMPFDRSMGIHKTACTSILSTADAIAADTSGNIYIQGTGPGRFAGVVELEQSSQTCSALDLKPQKGTAAGIAIDPSTNDLIVGDNPRSCRRPGDGRLIVYPPPYGRNGTIYRLSGVGCAGLFRLDAGTTGETHIFMLDANGGWPQIDQLRFPGMTFEGSYAGGIPSVPTTLPNVLPN